MHTTRCNYRSSWNGVDECRAQCILYSLFGEILCGCCCCCFRIFADSLNCTTFKQHTTKAIDTFLETLSYYWNTPKQCQTHGIAHFSKRLASFIHFLRECYLQPVYEMHKSIDISLLWVFIFTQPAKHFIIRVVAIIFSIVASKLMPISSIRCQSFSCVSWSSVFCWVILEYSRLLQLIESCWLNKIFVVFHSALKQFSHFSWVGAFFCSTSSSVCFFFSPALSFLLLLFSSLFFFSLLLFIFFCIFATFTAIHWFGCIFHSRYTKKTKLQQMLLQLISIPESIDLPNCTKGCAPEVNEEKFFNDSDRFYKKKRTNVLQLVTILFRTPLRRVVCLEISAAWFVNGKGDREGGE